MVYAYGALWHAPLCRGGVYAYVDVPSWMHHNVKVHRYSTSAKANTTHYPIHIRIERPHLRTIHAQIIHSVNVH